MHQFGGRTFAGLGVDAETLPDENQAKLGPDGPAGGRVTFRPWSPQAAPGLRPKVSLTMIVHNGEHDLPACLESVRDLFDETILVDTGSSDRTVEIARSFGARVFDFVWVDDFAAARNAALARATGDYAFWLDPSDVLDPPQREKLRALFDGLGCAGEAAYVVRCACDPEREAGGGETVVDDVRLFPLRGDVRWSFRVHEQILPALHQVGVPVRWTDVTIRQTGYTDQALRLSKLQRDEKILLEELGERPGDPFVQFNLASIAVERQDWRAALSHLRASLAGSAPTDSINSKLFALIARAHQMLGEPLEALAAGAAGLRSRANLGAFLNERGLLGMGAEVGVENGLFARCVLDQWRGKRLYLIDIWQPLDDYQDVTNAPVAEQVARLQRAVAHVAPHWERVRIVQELSGNAARLVPDGSLDWVYLDANHEYAHVLQDLAIWVPKVRPGGVIAGHDFLDAELLIRGVPTVFGVKRAVLEFFEGRPVVTTDEEFPTWIIVQDEGGADR